MSGVDAALLAVLRVVRTRCYSSVQDTIVLLFLHTVTRDVWFRTCASACFRTLLELLRLCSTSDAPPVSGQWNQRRLVRLSLRPYASPHSTGRPLRSGGRRAAVGSSTCKAPAETAPAAPASAHRTVPRWRRRSTGPRSLPPSQTCSGTACSRRTACSSAGRCTAWWGPARRGTDPAGCPRGWTSRGSRCSASALRPRVACGPAAAASWPGPWRLAWRRWLRCRAPRAPGPASTAPGAGSPRSLGWGRPCAGWCGRSPPHPCESSRAACRWRKPETETRQTEKLQIQSDTFNISHIISLFAIV